MNFWKTLKIVSFVALTIILGVLYMTSGTQTSQPTPTSSSSSSSDGSAFNGLK